MLSWYVVQTKPKKEDDVQKRLELAELEVLNPKIRSLTRGMTSLFPSYIFLKWDLFNPAHYHMVRYTRGVNKILGTPTCPVPISDEAVEVIQSRLDKNSVLEEQAMKVGSFVRVKKGVLKDLVGVLEKPVSPDGRVAILLRIYEREMRAFVDCRDVALVA